MDVQKLREELESQPFFKLRSKNIKWSDWDNQYVVIDASCDLRNSISNAEFANGALKAWQAKVDVVPATISDIQSWIAVNSFSALDAVNDDVPVVDANELAEYIDSLDLSVSVPEGLVLMPKEPTLKLSVAYEKNSIAPISSLSVRGYKAMIEAQEPSND